MLKYAKHIRKVRVLSCHEGGRGHEQSAVARQELNGRSDGVAEGVAEAAVEASMEYESVVERI